MNVIQSIHQALTDTIKALFAAREEIFKNITIQLNTDASKQQFGDISTNAALMLAKELQKSPREVAQTLQQAFKHHFVSHSEIAGPGFLNIFLTDAAFQELVQELAEQKKHFFAQSANSYLNYSIEFVSANPTGPLHIGHGRGGIIGDVLDRVLSFLGHKVTKEFYVNDAGAQMNKLGISFKIRCQQQAGMDVVLPEDHYQGEYLIALAQECYAEYGDALLTKSDAFFINYAEEHLLGRIKETLNNYGINFDVWFSEKTLHESGAIERVINQLFNGGFLYEKEGALWLRSTDFGDDKDRVVRKNTGELTYVAADIAYAENKIERGFDHLIMILGQDHHSYVTRLKAVMQALRYDPNRLDVILYQLVTIKESGNLLRLSKRKGRIVTLEDVIDTVGRDVARFFYLHKKADAHLDFDIDLALKHTDENPVYYIQYAYVRTKSIMVKAQPESSLDDISSKDSIHCGAEERMLIKKICSLQELLRSIERNYQTHLLAYYTIELAQTFHHYYSHHKVIDRSNVQKSRARLLIVLLVQQTLKICFDLLGIGAPEKM